MLIRIFILLILLINSTLTPWAYGQQDLDWTRNNKLGFKTGYAAFTLKDLVIDNFVYSGASVPIGFDYSNQSDKSQQKISLMFIGPDLRSDVYGGFSFTGDLTPEDQKKDTFQLKLGMVETFFFNFKYNYLGTIHTSDDEKYSFLLGGGFDNYLISKRFRSIEYVNSLTDKIMAFSVYGGAKYTASERSTFDLVISLPLVARMNRTLRLQEGVPDFYEFKKWVTINRMFGFNTTLNYNYRFAERWSLEADYTFLYYQYPFPRKVQFAMHNITVGINFHF